MRFPGFFLVFVLALLAGTLSGANAPGKGAVSGSVVDKASGRPVQFATVALKNAAGDTVLSTATDAKGAFSFENVPLGSYHVNYAPLGTDVEESPPFVLDAAHASAKLGALSLHGSAVKMESFEVKSTQAASLNSIDRKVYNVGKDIRSATGSASDLLQNVPSVQVDIDGNVRLRGDQNVLILIDGKPSSMMSAANRPDVLEQMPADSIEKIEVITNPSAKYKPDGTAGIINITLKRQKDPGYSGSIRASAGNDDRYNFTVSGNYRPGKYNITALASLRQDDRLRYSNDVRRHVDSATGATIITNQYSVEHSRPLSRLFQLGGDYSPNKADKFDLSLQYNFRTFYRTTTTSNLTRDAAGVASSDYDRIRTDPEWQKTQSVDGSWQHNFSEEGRELSLSVKRERHWEQEDNHYTNVYRTPAGPTPWTQRS